MLRHAGGLPDISLESDRCDRFIGNATASVAGSDRLKENQPQQKRDHHEQASCNRNDEIMSHANQRGREKVVRPAKTLFEGYLGTGRPEPLVDMCGRQKARRGEFAGGARSCSGRLWGAYSVSPFRTDNAAIKRGLAWLWR